MNYTVLNWDSTFFGSKVAVIEGEVSAENDFEHILEEMTEADFKLAYWFIPFDNVFLNELAVRNNGFLSDSKVTFSIDLKDCIMDDVAIEISNYEGSDDDKSMMDLAIVSGQHSRFKFDEKFGKKAFEDLYRLWMKRSINKEMADEVIVYSEGNKICGMITVIVSKGVGKIGLIGVDGESRGKKVGQKLINAVKIYCLEKNIKKIDVVTQLRNVNACKFYEKCGFSISDIKNVYHFWF